MMYTSKLSQILETFPVELVLWSVFGVTLLAFGVYSAILFWHWNAYSTGKYTTVSNMILYLSVSAVLLFVMISSVLWYSFS
jgi:hypothetical protein